MPRQSSPAGSPNPIRIQKYLGGLAYPASKQGILDKAQQQGADDAVLGTLRQLPEQKYDSPISISREVGKLH